MCDYFWQRMENDHGDLADIVRAGGQSGLLSNAGVVREPADDWLLPSSEPVLFAARSSSTAGLIPGNSFGDPFVIIGNPLLSPYGATAGPEFFDGAAVASSSGGGGDGDGGERFLVAPRNGMLPKVHPQICHGGFGASASSLARMDHGGGVQIATSPRAPGIKRRKSQAKKVVCIPAPAAASNRPTGEVVPCDLWAWRKYGQKPIKGSPYPRGYYRCSSSKGCSARKQVERSRTDPNMLVITYTSEHNHPWPTQRNALAGSIRSHPCKTASNHGNAKSLKLNDEELHESTTSSHHIKEEEEAATEISEEKTTSQRADHQGGDTNTHQTYRPMIPDQSDQPDDFFSDLAELDPDPINLIFSKAFLEAKADAEENKGALDPFHMFD